MRCKICKKKINEDYRILCQNCFDFLYWRYGSIERIDEILEQYQEEKSRDSNFNSFRRKK